MYKRIFSVFIFIIFNVMIFAGILSISVCAQDDAISTVFTALRDWEVKKSGSDTVESVTLPHTINGADEASDDYFRGTAEYTTTFTLTEAQTKQKLFLRFDKAGQQCTVTINDHTFDKHYGGYTPFVFDISDYVKVGENKITALCDNSIDWDAIPISADFNFCNGLYDNVYLIECGDVYFTSEKYGIDRVHLTESNVSEISADVLIETEIGGYAGNYDISCEILDMNGNTVKIGSKDINLDGSENALFSQNITIEDPNLWQGVDDPYLYTVKLTIAHNGTVIDTVSQRLGLRYFSIDKEQGFMLNGKPYPLRGYGMHQDYENVGAAATEELIDKDFEIIKESGANMLRLVHYPHSGYTYEKCDELGIIVQTEIPWINHCGENSTDAYFEHIKENVREMIVNFYNHPSVVFFGLSNELNGSHLKVTNEQGSYSYDLALAKTKEIYDYAKTLTSTHLVGAVIHRPTFLYTFGKLKEWTFLDWVGANIYRGWYGADFEAADTDLAEYTAVFPNLCISEYGAGGNPNTHSDDPLSTTNTGSGGKRHDEEYQNLFHENYLARIDANPTLAFTAAYCLFDFAVSGRNEGGTPYINDKGTVTRDRSVKKDVFYLYKAYFGKDKSGDPTVYITSRRFTTRDTADIDIKVYSDCDKLTLYQNGTEVQTLDKATDSTGVVWSFDKLSFVNHTDEFTVVGEKGETASSDTVSFTTTTIMLPAVDFTVGNALPSVSTNSPTDSLEISFVDKTGTSAAGSITWADNDYVTAEGNTVTLKDGVTESVVTELCGTLDGTNITKTVKCAINPKSYCTIDLSGAFGIVPETIKDTSGIGNNMSLSGFENTSSSGYDAASGALNTTGTETIALKNLTLPANKPYKIHIETGKISWSDCQSNRRVFQISNADDDELLYIGAVQNNVNYWRMEYIDVDGTKQSLKTDKIEKSYIYAETDLVIDGENSYLEFAAKTSSDDEPFYTAHWDIGAGFDRSKPFDVQLLNRADLTRGLPVPLKAFSITPIGEDTSPTASPLPTSTSTSTPTSTPTPTADIYYVSSPIFNADEVVFTLAGEAFGKGTNAFVAVAAYDDGCLSEARTETIAKENIETTVKLSREYEDVRVYVWDRETFAPLLPVVKK